MSGHVAAFAVVFGPGLVLLAAAGAVTLAAGTLGAVLWLRRFMVTEGRASLTHPAARRPSRATVTARPVLALPASQRGAIEAPRPGPRGGTPPGEAAP